jgi:micrococcal nuclease
VGCFIGKDLGIIKAWKKLKPVNWKPQSAKLTTWLTMGFFCLPKKQKGEKDMKKSLLILPVALMTLLSGCTSQYEGGEAASNPSAEEVVVQKTTATVRQVIDGDTIVISPDPNVQLPTQNNDGNKDSGEKMVRLLLVDAPESTKEKMVYGKEASQFLKDFLEGQTITFTYDKGEKEDKYGRQLCYVYLNDKMVQETLLENGLAIVRYVYPPNDTYLSQLKRAENAAKAQKLGVWSIDGYVKNGEYDKELGQVTQVDQLLDNLQEKLKETAKETLEGEIQQMVQKKFVQ